MINICFNADWSLGNAAGMIPGQKIRIVLPDGRRMMVTRTGEAVSYKWLPEDE